MFLISLIRLFRPHQWTKNAFVLAGLLFSGTWHDPVLLAQGIQAFFMFCFLTSAVYCINDVADVNEDRAHPGKCNRPVAAGAVSIRAALVSAFVLSGGALAWAWFVAPKLFLISGLYLVLNLAYSFHLKKQVLLDVFSIAFGFLLRILAGSWALGIPPSQWFFLCTFMLSLFLGFCKRYSDVGQGSLAVSNVAGYSREFLQVLIGVSLSASLITYGLYTMSPRTVEVHGSGDLIYSLPLVVFGLFRYSWLVMCRGFGGDTARDVVSDVQLCCVLVVYVGAVFLFIR